MAATQLRPAQDDPWRCPRWQTVRRWKGLRGEAKLSWFDLWVQAGQRPDTIVVDAAMLGAWQGTTDRSGRRRLEELAHHGLIDILDRFEGRFTVYVHDPLIVVKARRAPLESDSQGELFEADPDAGGVEQQADAGPGSADEPKSPAEVRPLPAAQPSELGAPTGFFCRAAADDAHDPPSLHQASSEGEVTRASSIKHDACTADDAHHPPGLSTGFPQSTNPELVGDVLARSLAAVADRVAEAHDLPARLERATRLAEWLKGTVGPECEIGPLLTIAHALIDGKLWESQVTRILARLNHRPIRKSRAAAFVDACKWALLKNGYAWREARAAARGMR